MNLHSLRSTVTALLFEPPLLAVSERIPILRDRCRGWRRTHPFDRAFGVDTSGFLPVDQLAVAAGDAGQMNPYAGCVPSVMRRSLQHLPSIAESTLVDLGCGKGRSSIVASEFPFRHVVGVDLSERMARTARANAAVIRRTHPDRPAIEIEVANGALYRLPPERKRRVVYFLYNSFPASLMPTFVDHVAAELRGGTEHAFLVYYNPVAHQAVDASPAFARFSAETLPVEPSERGFGPDEEDSVVIWQSAPARFPARPGADRAITVPADKPHASLAA